MEMNFSLLLVKLELGLLSHQQKEGRSVTKK